MLIVAPVGCATSCFRSCFYVALSMTFPDLERCRTCHSDLVRYFGRIRGNQGTVGRDTEADPARIGPRSVDLLQGAKRPRRRLAWGSGDGRAESGAARRSGGWGQAMAIL